MKILIIDNFDSFTFNLLHQVEKFCDHVKVIRYDKIIIEEIRNYDGIIISPGPGIPEMYEMLNKVVQVYQYEKNILGVCLGHQVIAKFYGATLEKNSELVHGISMKTKIIFRDEILFKNIPDEFYSARYHSWSVAETGFPDVLKITSVDKNNFSVMSFTHNFYFVKGVQFHPESVITEFGDMIISNWIDEISSRLHKKNF